MIKKFSILTVALQIILLLLYFLNLLYFINPPNIVLFPIRFLIGIAGFVNFIILIAKKKFIPLAIIMFSFGVIILLIGGLMRLFLTM